MRMIQSRALTSHTYNEDTARKIATEILNEYYPQFVKLKETLSALKAKEMQQS
ncbi:MAG: nucleotidyltransferase substrate binding protein [Desulfovermiculus sp.]